MIKHLQLIIKSGAAAALAIKWWLLFHYKVKTHV
jgi:hypothetical protein